MRTWIILFFLLLISSKSNAIGLGVELTTHTVVGNNGVIGLQTTSPINTLGSTFCAALFAVTNGVTSSSNINDSYGNAWTKVATTPNIGTNQTMGIFYSSASANGGVFATGPGHIFYGTASGSVFSSICVECFSGVLSSSNSFDVNASTVATTATTSQNTNSITPTSNNELIIVGVGSNNASLPYSVSGGFNITDSVEFNVNNYSTGMAYLVQSASAPISATWTKTGTASALTTDIAAFKAGPFVTNVPRSVIIK